jgi:hypothetical protein
VASRWTGNGHCEWKGRIVLSSAPVSSSAGSGAGRGPDVVFSDVVFSVIASPLIRARGQTARAVRGREGHRRLLTLAFPRDHRGHAPRRPSVGAGRDCPPRARARRSHRSTRCPRPGIGARDARSFGRRLTRKERRLLPASRRRSVRRSPETSEGVLGRSRLQKRLRCRLWGQRKTPPERGFPDGR